MVEAKQLWLILHLIGVHIVAVLGGQGPAHGQVDNISYYSQGEGSAQHVLPFTHCWQDGCRKARRHMPGVVTVCGSDTDMITSLNQACIRAEAEEAICYPRGISPTTSMEYFSGRSKGPDKAVATTTYVSRNAQRPIVKERSKNNAKCRCKSAIHRKNKHSEGCFVL